MVGIKKMFLLVVMMLFMWLIGAIIFFGLMVSGGDMMKEYMCPHGSCFETPV